MKLICFSILLCFLNLDALAQQQPSDIYIKVKNLMAEELQYTLEPKTSKIQEKEQDVATTRSDSAKILICQVSNSLNDTPLLILDGNPVEPAILNRYKTEDIKDVKILKDAQATAVYGSRASKGVILLYSKEN